MIEEIEHKAPNTQDPPPQFLWTIMCHRDTMEVAATAPGQEQSDVATVVSKGVAQSVPPVVKGPNMARGGGE